MSTISGTASDDLLAATAAGDFVLGDDTIQVGDFGDVTLSSGSGDDFYVVGWENASAGAPLSTTIMSLEGVTTRLIYHQ